eukprot:Blabericola_migrator_1__6842@NODE_3467_length_1748_cov_35_102915_g2156_i0_p1_GENE_NODE_3467_length_1748_cov_35_102915_g2156_i0NODE_3467_length_1748_cov_35_102915_g2156_i0_p1_ORF_typecomplete_len104_score1_01_NODE_3467_length_1748_cov_35_102915_g2156_i0410721
MSSGSTSAQIEQAGDFHVDRSRTLRGRPLHGLQAAIRKVDWAHKQNGSNSCWLMVMVVDNKLPLSSLKFSYVARTFTVHHVYCFSERSPMITKGGSSVPACHA